MRSSRVSPMPMRIPVVKGTESAPAAAMVASRTAGTLSGEPKWGPPCRHRRFEVLSSIRPWDAETRLSPAISSAVITPAFTWGRRPVSSSTRAHMAAR